MSSPLLLRPTCFHRGWPWCPARRTHRTGSAESRSSRRSLPGFLMTGAASSFRPGVRQRRGRRGEVGGETSRREFKTCCSESRCTSSRGLQAQAPRERQSSSRRWGWPSEDSRDCEPPPQPVKGEAVGLQVLSHPPKGSGLRQHPVSGWRRRRHERQTDLEVFDSFPSPPTSEVEH